MSTPLSASGRIVVPYTADGLTHRCVAYVRNPQLVGGVYQINSRTTDANDTTFAHAADGMIETMSYLFATTVAFSAAILELLSGIVWTPVATHTFGGTDHTSGTTIVSAIQQTLTLRDVNFKKVRVITMEGRFSGLAKSISTGAFGDARDTYIKQFTPLNTVPYAPYLWQVGRGDQYIQSSGLVSYIQAFNRKIRRARGLA